MNQSLLNWLNAVNHDENYPVQTNNSLLLAPIDSMTQDNNKTEDSILIHEINEPIPQVQDDEPQPQPQPQPEPERQQESEQEQEHESEPENECKPTEKILVDNSVEPEIEQEHEPKLQHDNESQELNTLIGIPDDISKENAVTEAEAITRELQSLKNDADSIQDKAYTLDLNKAWHEANAGLELSMKEPPPQIWTSRDENESDNENENEDYEHVILQQNSSVVLHGTNFTQRLQNILQGRKTKAAELKRKNSEENRHSHPYIRHALMMCMVMSLALGLAWLSLIYLQTKTPDSFSMKASELYEQGKYDEAMNLYQEAYNRYPEVLTFLEGIAKSAEKAGHSQTASIAWNEYRNALPDDDSKDREPVNKSEPLTININTGGDRKTPKNESREQEKTAMMFNEYLNEANRSFNIGMYNRALTNFFHALERRSDDIRPYIGIAESYRAKGMYFDANRILDEARVRFGINPSIEAAREFLKGSN